MEPPKNSIIYLQPIKSWIDRDIKWDQIGIWMSLDLNEIKVFLRHVTLDYLSNDFDQQ